MTSNDIVLTPTGLRFQGQRIPCSIGRGGIVADKHEGDGGTPKATMRIVAILYRPDRMPRPAAWAKAIGPGDLWSDDPGDPAYNCPVRVPHGFSHERLRRADRLYDLILVTDWNLGGAIRGGGSAIFVHRWRRAGYPTEGCIAMAPENLVWLTRRIHPGTRILVGGRGKAAPAGYDRSPKMAEPTRT